MFMDIELNKKYEIVTNRIRYHFLFLKSTGYKISRVTKENKYKNKTIVYRNKGEKRKIEITYHPFYLDNTSFDGFSVSIIRLPYTEVSDFMMLEKFLLKYKTGFNDKTFNANYYSGSFEERVDQALLAIVTDLKEYSRDVISGTTWEKGLYPEW